ncbi:uncharacterized protein [Dermacentor andersoni]|uniref:uncharacterized protein isoform X1 n=1 Tax=Dermacentor andersoni TaxID=34620 RepID=UPI0024179ED4|nr:tissue factor pathway inhibitor-like isoform X2 [Dermacentor andersoni]XP_054928687.1 tissue factor pathway inhibitor-like isoform X2 [Dermacentor andersoni]
MSAFCHVIPDTAVHIDGTRRNGGSTTGTWEHALHLFTASAVEMKTDLDLVMNVKKYAKLKRVPKEYRRSDELPSYIRHAKRVIHCCNGILCLEVENNRSQKSAEERSYVPPYPPYEYPDPEESDYDRRPDFCFLPHDPGHCRTWNPAHLWFYDRDLGACSPFIYSKCGGNRNRFRSCAECKEACKAEACAQRVHKK